MVTYKHIQNDIHNVHNLAVKNCWIAYVKKLNGFQFPGSLCSRLTLER
jgi:hypothetical protein